MVDTYNYDIAIIGAGPGGYVAGIRASQLGLKAIVIEKDKPGGVCLNIGCIPSKALINQADIYNSIKDLENMGLSIDKKEFDYSKVFQKSRDAADTLSKGVTFLLNKNKVEYIKANAKISGEHELSLDNGNKITAKNILIATGSSPRDIPGFKIDEKDVLSSIGILMLRKLPKSLIILGGGVIGIEFAHIMSSFGVEITIVEMLDQILPFEDEENVKVLLRAFKKRKINVMIGTKAISMEKNKDQIELTIEKDGKQSTLSAGKLLVSIGRSPNTSDIGLEKVGIEIEKGFIPVGEYYKTKIANIYAVGDIVNTPQLAHVASKEGEIAVENMTGHNTPSNIDPLSIPRAVYCEPQIASFGLTEAKIIEQGIKYKKAIFPYRGVGKAVVIGKIDGQVKILTNENTKEIIGAHIVGAEATELIHEILLARSSELLPEDIATMIHAHPTLSEGIMESMRALEGWAIHI